MVILTGKKRKRITAEIINKLKIIGSTGLSNGLPVKTETGSL